jgi:tetratricopeptide (TPR) repeat protein
VATLTKHAGPGLVAVLYVALALAEGGYDTTLLAAAGLAIWWAVIIGLFVRAWPGAEAPRAALTAGLFLFGLGVVTGLSTIWADDAGRAFEELARLAAYLGLFVLCVLVSRPGSAGGWARGLAAGLAAVAALALLSRFEPGLFGDAVREVAREVPSAAGRLSYPIGYWNGLASCMALACVLLAWLAVRAGTRNGRAAAAAGLALPVLAIYLAQSLGGALAAVVGFAVLLGFARERLQLLAATLPGLAAGGALIWLASRRQELVDGLTGSPAEGQGHEMLALTVALVALAALAAWAVDPRLRALRAPPAPPRWAIAGAAAVLAVVAVGALDPGERWEEFKDPGQLGVPASDGGSASLAEGQLASAAGNGRYQWWSEALDAFESEPVTGIGAANYELYWNQHNTLPVVVTDAHSLYLETLAELGILGLLLLLGFFATAIAAGVERRRSSRGEVAVWIALIAAALTSAAAEWTWEIPAAIVPAIVAAAVLTGPATLRPRFPRAVDQREPRTLRERLGSASGPRERFGLGVATMLTGFACIWITGTVLLTAVQLDESREAVDRGELEEAARNARYAAAIEPWAAEPRLQLAQVEELRGRLAEAREAAEEAIERSPGDWQGWVVLARIQSREGDPAEAEESLRRVTELTPVTPAVELPGPQ